MILAREEWFPFQHLRKDATRTPDINFNIVFLPREHDLRRSVVACRDITSHLRVLDTGQAEITDFQIAILIDKDIAGFKIPMDNACGVDIFQTSLTKGLESGC